jgi:hypothetical protein
MQLVCRSRRTQSTAILAAVAVLTLGVLPAEHVHAWRTSDGHAHDVVHRHFDAHHRTTSPVSIDDADDELQWLSTSFTGSRARVQVRGSAAVAELHIATSQPKSTSRAIGQVLYASVHDPPWATSSGLRAPPISRL